jgi:hypothetical protein
MKNKPLSIAKPEEFQRQIKVFALVWFASLHEVSRQDHLVKDLLSVSPHAIPTLNLDQLEALGIEFPQAGESFSIRATAVVTHSSTSDPDADTHVEAACVVLTLVDLTLDADGSRFARNAARMYGTGALDPDGGGTTGAYGKLNAPVGG